jgi:hypothetical protein
MLGPTAELAAAGLRGSNHVGRCRDRAPAADERSGSTSDKLALVVEEERALTARGESR